MSCLPDLLKQHDVSGGTHLRTLTVTLDPGDSITGATIVAINKDTRAPLVGDTLRIVGDAAGVSSTLTWGLISSAADGDLWGVSFYMLSGSPQVYWLELDYFTASQPGVLQYPELYRVEAVA